MRAYCYEGAREEGQCQYGYSFHSRAVLPGFLCHLCSGFGELDVQQVISPAFFGDSARALRNLDVESVVSLDVEVRDLRQNQY
jgi:hypothetical protein